MIRREIEKISPLRIAVIGYNREQTANALKQIAETLDQDKKLRNYSPHAGIVLDREGNFYKSIDSRYTAISTWDQLIIADDYRWTTIQNQAELIDYVVSRIDENIPENYKVEYMEV